MQAQAGATGADPRAADFAAPLSRLTLALVDRFENGVVTVKLGRTASAGTTVVERTL